MALPKRLRVIVPGFLIGTAVSAFFGSIVAFRQPVLDLEILLVFFGPLVGPFAAPLGVRDPDVIEMVEWGTGLALLIGFHPFRPNGSTAFVSGCGLCAWFLAGLAWTYNGV